MNLTVRSHITMDDYQFVRLAIAEGRFEPRELLSLLLGWRAMLLNQLIYDTFHGKGWKLNLLTGRYERE